MEYELSKIFDPYETRPLQIIARALKKERLAHAYLITGMDRTITTKAAISAANLLLCEQPKDDKVIRPCGECKACLKVSRETHPDLIVVEPEGATIKIDQIKTIQKQFIFQPLEGKKRIAVISQADTLGIYAGNALLKILEEPPPYAHLILGASTPKALLQTVVSRCQHLPLGSLPARSISSFLKQAGMDNSYVQKMSEGSLSKATYFIESDLIGFRDKFIEFLKKEDRWESLLLNLAQKGSQDNDSFKLLLHIITSVIHDMMILNKFKGKSFNSLDKVLFCPDIQEDLVVLAIKFDNYLLEEYASHVMNMETHLSRNANKLLMALSLLLFWKNKKFGRVTAYG